MDINWNSPMLGALRGVKLGCIILSADGLGCTGG